MGWVRAEIIKTGWKSGHYRQVRIAATTSSRYYEAFRRSGYTN
jgi:hypothetical protein